MKAVTVREAEGQLGQLITEACNGEFILLTHGDKQVALEPRIALDPDEDSPQLEAELLRAVTGPHPPLREGELRDLADKALMDHRARTGR